MHSSVWKISLTATLALQTLIVGGGPSRDYNQVAIESNVRYIWRLLAGKPTPQILFADGSTAHATVLYQDARGHERYRRPQLPALNGPSRLTNFKTAFDRMQAGPTRPAFLYFTGHGSPDGGDYQDNDYDLWHDETLSVTDLAEKLDTLPPQTSVTIVMVQCYSGAFGNVLFKDGDPKGEMADQNICGFFASVPSRPAAGCTSEVDEANYKDFTSYFFAALSGRDRLGKPVTGADYDHDGRVGMDEAYAYTLIHDRSIDTPVCTSDTFLRRFVPMDESQIFQTPYTQVRSWGTPAQSAALDALSRQLALSGEDRLTRAYAHFQRVAQEKEDDEDPTIELIRMVRLAKSIVLAHHLMTEGDPAIQVRFTTLRASEARNPLKS